MTSPEARHDDRMIDEALEETFPASDPITPAAPGSLIGRRYAVTEDETTRAQAAFTAAQPWLLCALAGGVIVGLLLRRRHRN